MKKNWRNKISAVLFATILLTLAGCEKEIPFDDEVRESKLVVNSYFNADEVWTMHVSKSLSVIDAGDLTAIGTATIKVTDTQTGTEVILTNLGDGLYGSATEQPVIGKNYRVDVSASGYESISGEDKIPVAINVLSLDTETVVGADGDELNVTIVFQDDANTSNYYQLRLWEQLWLYEYDGMGQIVDSTEQFTEAFFNTDLTIADNHNNAGFYDNITFSDQLIDGEQHEIQLRLVDKFGGGGPGGGGPGGGGFDEGGAVFLEFVTGSYAYYQYARSLAAYRAADGNPFAQPVQMYTNITGGFGIFSGYSSVYQQIK